jgi:PKD repeat protein
MFKMKKLCTLIMLGLLVFTGAMSQNITVSIHGTVTDDSLGAPIANHPVYIYCDSTNGGFGFYATRTTSSTGQYDCTIHNVPGGISIPFIVKTFDCLQVPHVDTAWSQNSPVEANFVICNYNAPPCHANFTYSGDSLNPLTFHFFDTSTPLNLVVAREWHFGDGSPAATTADPWHIYPAPGVYTVCLTITTSSGCTSTTCNTVHAVSGGGDCHAAFVPVPDSSNGNGYMVHFYDQSTGNPVGWSWNFGDPASGATNVSSLQNPSHVFSSPGIYHVCLTTTCNNQTTSTTCDSLFVGNPPANCESWFTKTVNYLTVAFEGHTNSQYPTTYTWLMGDPANTTLTGQNVTFTYPVAGVYTVTLTTVDSTNCAFTSTQTFHVFNTCDVNGFVVIENSFADHGFVELIRSGNGLLTVVDTAELADSMGSFHFGGVEQGNYYLKATLTSNSAYYGQYVPTYYEHAINWGAANVITLGQPANPYYIHMFHVIALTPGSGTIQGTINQSLKMSQGGTPASNVEVLLLDAENQPFAYATTDAEGKFAFANLALGQYTIYPECAGKTTVPAHITLDNSNTTADVSFTMDQGSVIFGINASYPKNISGISGIYPNPAKDRASITLTVTENVTVKLSILSLTGQVVNELSAGLHKGENTLTLPVSNFQPGIYYVRITGEEGGSFTTKFIVSR